MANQIINKDQSDQSKNNDKSSAGVQPKKSFFCYWVDILVAERNLKLGGDYGRDKRW